MTEKQALKKLQGMTDKKFQAFFKALPERVKLLVRTGFVDWKRALPQWYIKIYE